MSSSITCSTKILTLEIVPFLFILLGVLCKFTMVPGVYIFPQDKRGTLFFLRAQSYTFNSALYNHDYVLDELEKTQTRISAVLWCL